MTPKEQTMWQSVHHASILLISQVDAPIVFVVKCAYTHCAKPMPVPPSLLLNEQDPISTPDWVHIWIERYRERVTKPGTMAEKLYR